MLAVLIAVALLGLSLPALDDARTATTADRIDAEADRLERAAAGLAADSVAVDDPTLAARVTVPVRVPTGLTAARVDRVVVGDPSRVLDDESPAVDAASATAIDAALIYWMGESRHHTASISPSTPLVSIRTADGPIELRPDGRSRLELRLVDGPDGPTVRVARAG